MESLLEINDLTIAFDHKTHQVRVVHGVGLHVQKGEILGLVGESGSGKSLTCFAVMRLLAKNAIVHGSVRYDNRDIFALKEKEMTHVRGRDIAMIFQDAIGALNPVQTIGKQLIESLQINAAGQLNKNQAKEKAIELLHEVGIPDPTDRLKKYPHELSGGQNQRIVIAMMLAGDPALLIADEPTTALDVTIQAQILRLLKRLRKERNMAIILVTHDLGVVAETCDRMAVMYCGRIVETGTVQEVFAGASHPYTSGLLASRPRADQKKEALQPIPGVVPMPANLPDGCSLAPRCTHCSELCHNKVPGLIVQGITHSLACFHPLTTTNQEERNERNIIS